MRLSDDLERFSMFSRRRYIVFDNLTTKRESCTTNKLDYQIRMWCDSNCVNGVPFSQMTKIDFFWFFCDDIRILNFMFTQIIHVIQYQIFFLASTRNK